jgi:hypothetical protein
MDLIQDCRPSFESVCEMVITTFLFKIVMPMIFDVNTISEYIKRREMEKTT